MGKYRSKSGCQTCRQRRVKCDEQRPTCGQCSKKARECLWEAQHSRFRGYRPGSRSSETTPGGLVDMDVDGEDDDYTRLDPDSSKSSKNNEDGRGADGDGDGKTNNPPRPTASMTPTTTSTSTISTTTIEHDHAPLPISSQGLPRRRRRDSQPEQALVHPPGLATAGLQQTSSAPFLPGTHMAHDASTSTIVSVPPAFSAALPSQQPKPLTRDEARLVRHYVETLGRWLDGTDSARQFTLRVPEHARHCPILLHAIQSFAARHLGDDAAVDDAYHRCITLLIERLNLNIATHDEDLLCAIVILHFFEQLNAPFAPDPDDHEQHLTGSSAILRASQTGTIDPSAPTLREAAFWVYVRQCLFKSTLDQQPPNIDFSLRLHPEPATLFDLHPLARLRLETAWTNQMTWHCAYVVNFCFDKSDNSERAVRMRRWQDLCDAVNTWRRERPPSFDSLWTGAAEVGSTFPQKLFTADWHVLASTYFHFSHILLLTYKPGLKPGFKFAIRSVHGKLSETDAQILEHARKICGNCKSSPSAVSSFIILCHTIFIWGPLLFDADERDEVLDMFASFQRIHKWPTAWIVSALRAEWGLEQT